MIRLPRWYVEMEFTKRREKSEMRIGLVSYRCINKDVPFNLRQIERAMKEAQGKADLLCFGEAYLQGFDALCWDYETDKQKALEITSDPVRQLSQWTKQYRIALLTGYIEKEQDRLYSSCIVLENGEVLHNYRRISKGWKEYWKTDEHYLEGKSVSSFCFHDKTVTIALCGDLWEFPERFKTDGLLIWPVYVNFSTEEWERQELANYARQALLAANDVLMVNPIDFEPENHGGAFHFKNGEIVGRIPFDQEGILIVDLDEGI